MIPQLGAQALRLYMGEKRWYNEGELVKAIPHKDSAADALSDFSSDCTEIPKAY